MTLNKYSKVMSRVELTDEMKSHILSGINGRYKQKHRNKFLQISALAASILLVFTIAFLVPRVKSDKEKIVMDITDVSENFTGTQDHNEPPVIENYANLSELANASGYPVREISYLPFEATGNYTMYNGVAVIDYYNQDDILLSYGIYPGDGDRSGFEWPFTYEKVEKINGRNVTIKGDDYGIEAAFWKDDDYTRFVTYECGLSIEELEKIIK